MFLLVASGVCAGQVSDSPSSRTLTLEQALDLAERNNPRLKVSASMVEIAEAGVRTARARPNPSVSASTFGRQAANITDSVGGMLHGFTFNQPLELSNLRRTRIGVAEAGRASERFALAETRLAVRGAVKQAFYEVLRRKGEVEVTRGNLQLLEELRARIETLVKQGESGRLELTRADAELAGAKILVQSAELRRSVALSSLYAAVGAPLAQFDPVGSLDASAKLPTLDELRDEVMKAHPSIAQADAETRRAEAGVSYQRAQRTPQPTVWADFFRQPDVTQYRYGVTIDLPVWNRREGQIAEAVATSRAASSMARQRRLEISAALERAYTLYQIANQQVQMFESGTLRIAETALEASQTAFRFGERSIIEVLDAQRVLRAARQDYLNAQFDRQQALIELEQLRAVSVEGTKP